MFGFACLCTAAVLTLMLGVSAELIIEATTISLIVWRGPQIIRRW